MRKMNNKYCSFYAHKSKNWLKIWLILHFMLLWEFCNIVLKRIYLKYEKPHCVGKLNLYIHFRDIGSYSFEWKYLLVFTVKNCNLITCDTVS